MPYPDSRPIIDATSSGETPYFLQICVTSASCPLSLPLNNPGFNSDLVSLTDGVSFELPFVVGVGLMEVED